MGVCGTSVSTTYDSGKPTVFPSLPPRGTGRFPDPLLPQCSKLAFRPLRSTTCTLETELLAFFGARITFEITANFEVFALFRSDHDDGAGEAVAHGICLCFVSATVHFHRDRIGEAQQLHRSESSFDHSRKRKIFLGGLAIDHHRRGFC